MKFDSQLRPATETSWVVSYNGKTIPRWRTAAILKIVISPYLSEKSYDFDEILYTAADFELDERHVIKNKKSCIGQTPSSTERISYCTSTLFALPFVIKNICLKWMITRLSLHTRSHATNSLSWTKIVSDPVLSSDTSGLSEIPHTPTEPVWMNVWQFELWHDIAPFVLRYLGLYRYSITVLGKVNYIYYIILHRNKKLSYR